MREVVRSAAGCFTVALLIIDQNNQAEGEV